MSFTDTSFILAFLPIFIIVYAIVPNKLKSVILLVGSLAFYYFATGINETILLLVLVIINFLLALAIGSSKRVGKTLLLILTLLLDVGFLAYFKYFRSYLGLETYVVSTYGYDISNIAMLGVSFFTFQLCSYLADIYKVEIVAEKNILAFSNSIVAFPKIISGPLVRYGIVKDELKSLHVTRKRLEEGFEFFVFGLLMKVILADTLSGVWDNIQMVGYDSISTPLAWIGILSFSLRLYFDFQGYSLMAIGIGEMIGLTIPTNFNHPYMSSSISEFWRRWHMTLGEWFRDYIYIPLGGNKKGLPRTIINLFVVWLLTGLWHGSTYNFIIWGLINFALVAIEKLFLGKWLKNLKVLPHIYVIFAVMMFWVVFAIPDINDVGIYFMRLFPFIGSTCGNVYALDYVDILSSYGVILAIGIFACFPILQKVVSKYCGKFWLIAIEFILFWFAIYLLVERGSSSFMYFAF